MRLGATKQRILERLRLRKASAAQLAGELGLSKVAVYRHLEDLKGAGLVRARTQPASGRGRPTRLFEAIDEPTAYARMCRELLEQVEEVYGPGAGVRVLRARYKKELEAWSEGFRELELEEKARRLAEWLSERGYHAVTLSEGSGLVLEQRRCPKLALAREYPAVCQAEIEFFSELLGVSLVRERSLASGDACCRYRIELEQA